MIWQLDTLLNIFAGSFRIGGMIMSLPLFAATPVPPAIRVFVAIAVAGLIYPLGQYHLPQEIFADNYSLALVVGREFFIGTVIGFGARMVFLVTTLLFDYAGQQMGFAMASIFDPQNGTQVTALAQIGVVLTILFFFMTNMHHHIFYALVRSFKSMPPGLPDFQINAILGTLMHFIKSTFEVSLRLSMPIMVAMLVIQFVMGIISRTAPQMNLFFNVSFMISLVSGLLLVVMNLKRLFPAINRFEAGLAAHGYGLW